MAREPKAGDNVAWKTSQGETTGKVVEKVTQETKIKGHVVAASPENPEYIVESDRCSMRSQCHGSAVTATAMTIATGPPMPTSLITHRTDTATAGKLSA